jgi:hypothetical protein
MTPTTTRVVLNRPHTHAGQRHGPGDAIDVDATTADWLVSQSVAQPQTEPVKTDPDFKPVHRKEPKP